MKSIIAAAIAVTTISFGVSVLDAGAQEKLRLDGSSRTIEITPGQGTLTLLGTSTGNLTSVLTLSVNAPSNAEMKLYARKIPKQKGAKPGGWYGISYQTEQQAMERRRECKPIGVSNDEEPTEQEDRKPEDFPSLDSPVCDLFSGEDKAAIEEQLETTFGGEWSPGNICAYLVAMSYDPDLGGKDQWCALYDWNLLLGLGIDCFPSSLFATYSGATFKRQTLTALLRRDSCGSSKDKYDVKVQFKLPQSSSTYNITISGRLSKHTDGREASIKPVSEGRFAPKPLILMSWLGTTCGNEITAVKWKNNKPGQVQSLPIYSFLSYRNLILALATADKALKGGKGTFELHDGRSAYGVCLDMARRRQRVNGYPG